MDDSETVNDSGKLPMPEKKFTCYMSMTMSASLACCKKKLTRAGFDVTLAESGNLRELCTQLEQAFTAQADSRQLRFTVTVQADTPEFILSDRFRVYQLLGQLISNAFKFTKQGVVNVLVRQVGAPQLSGAVNSIAPKCFIEFAVTDTGCGVAVSELEHIFQVFEQADNSNTRQHGGMGLGLSISKRLAELLGGSLGVESEAGKGSTFTLWLPLSPRLQYLQ